MRKFMIQGLLACCILLFSSSLHAVETPVPAPPQAWVTDPPHFMTPAAAADLNLRLEAYEKQTGHQMIVWIGSTTGDATIEAWSLSAFNKWGIGRKDINDGIALFIMVQDQKIRIELGRGFEKQVSDATASRIIRDILAPQISAGNKDAGIVAAMEALATAVGGPSLPARAQDK
jgi:uncharacterized protein